MVYPLGEWRFQKDAYDFLCKIDPRISSAERKHVGVVVFARHTGGKRLGTERTTDFRHLIGGNTDTDPRRADEHAPVAFSARHGFRRNQGKIGIVAGVFVSRAEILRFIALLLELIFNGVF